jgi:anti-sigma regulatory factor (Ser/Thr protein kinase)
VEFVFRLTRDALEIDVRDSGPGFNLSIVEDAGAPENLLKPRGRGIFIMRSMMDRVSYDFTHGGTICHLVKTRRDGNPLEEPGPDVPADRLD